MTVGLSTRERGLLKGAYEQVKCALALSRAPSRLCICQCLPQTISRRIVCEDIFARCSHHIGQESRTGSVVITIFAIRKIRTLEKEKKN